LKKNKKISEWLIELPIVGKIIEWAKERSLPGFDGVPVYDVIVFLFQEAKKDDIVTRANSMAFSFFLALFPTLIFLFTCLPLMPFSANYLNIFEEAISGVLPHNAEIYLLNMMRDIMSIPRGGLLSIGFVLAMVFASNGMNALLRGFNKSYEISYFSRNFFKNRLVALKLSILIIILFIASIILIVGSKSGFNYLFEFIDAGEYGQFGLKLLRWMIVVFLFYSGISVIYRYGPALRKKFKFITPGATMATLFSILSSLAFAYFVNNFASYNKIYGSIGALIVIMLWLQINCFILLAGYELNASIAVNRDLKKVRSQK
jgi:membrane protein